ncbi:MAG: antirestriction protein ArdA [Henriciella sp.]|nr:antirestriction protein ArdA [Henriciella sp.]
MTANSQSTALLVAKTVDTPRIYLACLAAYNNGRLHGAWVDADQGADHIWNELRKMLRASPEPDAEEWAIHDYDGFESAHIPEYASFEKVCDLAEFLSERGELGAQVYSIFSEDLDQAKAAFDDYSGEFSNLAEFAEQLHEDIGTEIPEILKFYVDWASLGRDLELNGDIFTVQISFDETHVFWSR